MLAVFVHQLDPIITTVGGMHLWWYGLSYALGFLSLRFWLQRARGRLGLTAGAVEWLTLAVATGVVLGGRLVEVIGYEWPFYRDHPQWISAVWLGGMATHGLLLGGLVAAWGFARARGISWWVLLDELAVPAALIMGLGRIGNFIDGQIVGSLTTLPWGVQFPDADGFRHPVVLYDGLKNLLLVPLLLWLRRRRLPRGALAGQFLFWYAGLRVFVDLFREYPTTLFGLPTGQALNLLMVVMGLLLVHRAYRLGRPTEPGHGPRPALGAPWLARLTFAALLALCLTIPSDWTQDVPRRYGHRHDGLEHSWWYPALNEPQGVRQ